VKIQPQWVVTPGKQTNKQTNKHSYAPVVSLLIVKGHFIVKKLKEKKVTSLSC
jgi:hypothetical protein